MEGRLVIVRGTRVGESVVLGAMPIVVGRDPGCHFALPDQGMSRRHFQVTPTAQGFVLEDLGSSNGTTLRGAKLTSPVVLMPGDEFEAGGQAFRFEVPTAGPRKIEVGSAERMQTASAAFPPNSSAPGCAPVINGLAADFSGVVPWLFRIFPWLFAILVGFAILSMLVRLIGAIVDAATGSHGSPQSQQSNSPPSPSNQPEQSGEGIQILETNVEITVQGPVIKVKWRNGTSKPISRFKGDITVTDDSGSSLLELKDADIYSGSPVDPGQTHTPERRDGIGLPMGTSKGKIKITPTTAQ